MATTGKGSKIKTVITVDENSLGGKSLSEVDYKIDKSLLGGMVIRIGDQVLDNSIRSKLDALSRQLSEVRLSN